jgi:hypothetical protein
MKVVPKDASDVQIEETKQAFFSGGISIFYLMLNMMDEGLEPTAQDLRKMSWLSEEMDAFAETVKNKFNPKENIQ